MATVVDICNMALSHLGDRATVSSIDPPEGSAQADSCARFYPIARDQALEEYSWTFATRREALTLTDFETDSWAYAYFRPNECLTVQRLVGEPISANASAIFETVGFNTSDVRFVLEVDASGREIILTNHPDAWCLFTAKITDPSRYSAKFVVALSWLLASHLAGPVLKGTTGAKAAVGAYKTYETLAGAAAARNMTQENHKRDYTPQSMGARGVNFRRNRQVGA